MPGTSGAEVVLIEFLGDAKSAVAAGEETVGVLDQVTVAAERAGEAQQQAGVQASAAAKETKTAAASSASAMKKQAAAAEEVTAATDAEAAAQKRAAKASQGASAAALGQSKAWKKNTAAISAVGSGLTKYVSLPLLAIGAVATKMSLDFSKAMLLIETHTDTSKKTVDSYRKSIEAMSKSGHYTQGPKELAEAMYHVASDGYQGAKALEVLRESAHLATLGQSNLAETTYALVSVMKTGIKGTSDMRDTIGTLNAVVGAGDLQMQDLVGAMSTGIMPAAKGVGLSLKDVGAALDIMTQRGVPAQQAAYRLSMNFQQLVPYTEKAQDAFKQLGLGQYEIAKQVKGPTGFLDALKLLQSHLDKFGKYQQGTIIRDIFGGGRTSRGMLMLLQNLGSMEHTYEHINSLQGKTNENLKKALKSPANVWAKEWAKLQGTLVEVGDQLVPVVIPALHDVASAITGIASAFNALPDSTHKWIIELGLALIALGPIVKTVAGIGKMITTISETSLFGAGAEATVGAGAGAAAGGAGAAAGAGEAAGAAGAAAGGGELAAAAGGLTLGTVLLPVGVGIGVAALTAAVMNTGDAFDTAHKKFNAAAQDLDKKSVPAWKRTADAMKAVRGEQEQTERNRGLSAVERETPGLKGALLPQHGTQAHQSAADLRKAMAPVHRAREEFGTAIGEINMDQLAGLGKLNADLATALQRADNSWKHGTKGWRNHVVEAMQETVHSIKSGMASGSIPAEAGQKKIDRILAKIRLVKGTDPIGLASGIVASFKKAGGVTQHGIDTLLHDFDQMPKGAREKGQDAVLEMANAWAKGHPKIEHEVDVLRHNLDHSFGETSKSMGRHMEEMTEGVSTDFGNMADAVGTSVEDIEGSVGFLLNKLEIGKVVNFSVGAGNFHAAGVGPKRKPPKKARGGYLEGSGRRDTEHVMAAPGEAFLTHQQQGPVSVGLAASKAMGLQPYGSLGELFSKETTPHYMATGGVVHPKIGGSGKLHDIGQASVDKVWKQAGKFVSAHTPKGGGGIPSFSGPWVQVMEKIAKAKGWNLGDWRKLVNQESGGDPTAVNPSSGAFGLGQFLGSTLQAYKKYGAGSHNPARQIEAMAHYIADRYGSPTAAWGHETSAGWYAKGGFVAPDRMAPQTERDAFAQALQSGRIQYKKGGGKTEKTKAPSALENMLARVKQLNAWHVPYPQPDTHGGFSSHPAFLDCSAAVSDVLHTGGFLDHEEVSGELESFGESGPGKVTIFANAGHAFMNMLGRFWGTSVDDDGAGGLGFHSAPSAEYLSSFVKRHVPEGALGSATGASSGSFSSKVPAQVTGAYTHVKKEPTISKTGVAVEKQKRHYKVQTGALSFGSTPGTLAQIQKELSELRNQKMPEYKAAIKDTKDPETKAALEKNLHAIRQRIVELVRARAKLLRERMQQRTLHRIAHRGVFPDLEEVLKKREDGVNTASEHAEHLMALEPEDRGMAANFGPALSAYINGQEKPAWLGVLGAENIWRSTILHGEGTVTKRIGSLQDQVAGIQALKGKPSYKKQKWRLPALKEAIANAKTVYDPKTGLGTLADELVSVQGNVPLKTIEASLPTTPDANSFGGMIFDTQMTIRELGLKIEEAMKSSSEAEENPALLAATQAIAEQSRRGKALAEVQYAPFSEFLKQMPPYIGAFKSGGFIPGGVNQAYTATVHGGETIVPAGGGQAPDVHLHLHGDLARFLQANMPGIVEMVEKQTGKNYRHLVFSPSGGR